ncbi:hypothetical protein BV898_13491 [Hypsibius exemplaris]|uniref:Uncharacterized protein n=1 Tax=Hypsibius exemplaris TaxID=2072580 RepID=A0A1W0WAI8_HYPEX|nr:hypothetical protein BV898_13491 [Hypsibius exemplaris]
MGCNRIFTYAIFYVVLLIVTEAVDRARIQVSSIARRGPYPIDSSSSTGHIPPVVRRTFRKKDRFPAGPATPPPETAAVCHAPRVANEEASCPVLLLAGIVISRDPKRARSLERTQHRRTASRKRRRTDRPPPESLKFVRRRGSEGLTASSTSTSKKKKKSSRGRSRSRSPEPEPEPSKEPKLRRRRLGRAVRMKDGISQRVVRGRCRRRRVLRRSMSEVSARSRVRGDGDDQADGERGGAV